MSARRILLGQLGGYGDCLYATTIARQIKIDYPGCHLTWAIGSPYRSVLNGNPFVDQIWEIPITSHQDDWAQFEKEVIARKESGDFDEVFLTQISPNNFKNFDGTVRSSLFRGYPKPITVPVDPVMRLDPEEVEKVRCFAKTHRLSERRHIILFECAPSSGQSFVTPVFAREVAQKLIDLTEDALVILSSAMTQPLTGERIIDGSVLSFRENAELTKYCSLVVGCSSGISWLCTSDWAKPLPMVQLLAKKQSLYASFIHDYESREAETSSFIEMTDSSTDKVARCLAIICEKGFEAARSVFNENIPLRFNFYTSIVYGLLIQGKHRDALISLGHALGRYGPHRHLLFCIFRMLIKYFLRSGLGIAGRGAIIRKS